MKISEIYGYINLLLAAVLLYYLFSSFIGRKKYKVQDLFNTDYQAKHEKKRDEERFSLIKNSRLKKWIYPEKFIKEANKFEWNLSIREYWLYVAAGGSIAAVIMSIFSLGSFSIFGFPAGLIVPKVLLSFHRLRYKHEVEEKLMAYMKAVSNAIPTAGNAIDAIVSVTEMLKDPIKSDVEYALSILRSGESVQNAFQSMNEKYDYSDLIFFHNMLDAAHRNGAEFYDILASTADEFEQKKVLQAKLNSIMTQAKRAYFQNAGLLLAIIVGFKIFVSDMFDSTFSTLGGKAVLGFILISVIFCYVQVQKHSEFDPSEAHKK